MNRIFSTIAILFLLPSLTRSDAPPIDVPEIAVAAAAAADRFAAAQNILVRRKARADGDIAWVASESQLDVQRDGKQ